MSEKKSALATVARVGAIVAAVATRDPQLAALIASLAEPGALTVGHIHEWYSGRGAKRAADTTGQPPFVGPIRSSEPMGFSGEAPSAWTLPPLWQKSAANSTGVLYPRLECSRS